jgi:undecaprenyl-diphosphatase
LDLLLLFKAAIMGVVEGLTEFLPVSSTGHLILAGALLRFDAAFGGDKAKVFEIAIQTGAIFAVIWVYWQRLVSTLEGLTSDPKAQRFAGNVALAFAPAALLGVAFKKAIDAHLFNALVVASTFILGGLIILWAEKRQAAPGRRARIQDVDDMRPLDALKVGLAQAFSLVPGTSRSGATIIGGMLFGLSRQAATDFSFFLAIPTLIGAGVYSLFKARHALAWADAPVFLVGLVVSFIGAWLCVRWLLRFISTHSFNSFAWYRIAFGLLILLTWRMGWVDWSG